MTEERAPLAGDGPVAAEPGRPGTLETRTVHDGRIVHLSIDTVRFPDDSTGDLEMIRHPGASAVLPLLGGPSEDDPDVLLLKQYRYASGGWLYEVPAGIPDRPDEPWEDCARRELEEETGWKAGRLRRMTRIFTTPGFTDEVIHLFVAWELERGARALDDDEFLEVVRVPFSRALDWVREGRIVDGKSVAAVLYAGAFVVGGR
jgi:ADP-ribose pyrophosphatase